MFFLLLVNLRICQVMEIGANRHHIATSQTNGFIEKKLLI